MIIPSTRHESKKASNEALNMHLDYLEDITHPDHAGLTLHPACNYNSGPTAADFAAAIEENRKKYLEVSPCNGWEEAVCCMGDGSYHTATERDAIEKIIIGQICPDSPARTVWNEDPETGKGLLRIIFPAINPQGKPNLERNKARQLKLMEALDEQIANMLNTSSNKPAHREKHIQTAHEVAKNRARKFANP